MFKRGFPIYRDFANRTYDTVNQMFQKYFQTKNDLTPEAFKDIYKRMEQEGFIDLINNMIDYYETDNYIYTHGFIPVNGFCNPYYNDNCTYDPEWRISSEKKFKNFRWINGIEISMNYNIGEP